MYADDTQIYITFKQREKSSNILDIQNCLKDIKIWSNNNGLTLNDNKTEFIHVTSRHRSCSPISNIALDNISISSVPRARNLGVTFDAHLSMNDHINNVCRAASFALHKIGSIRHYLDQKSAEKLIHSLVMCRIDSCNSLLYGLPDLQISKLQRIQNTAARLVTRSRTHDHITPILQNLHWLPIRSRIAFKILVLTYHCLHGTAPAYLQDLIQQYQPARNLRSKNKHLLSAPAITSTSYGSRSFQNAAVHLWNSLPNNVKLAKTTDLFKTRVKTHLFNQCYHS